MVIWVLSPSPANVLFSHGLTGSLPGPQFPVKQNGLPIYREHYCRWYLRWIQALAQQDGVGGVPVGVGLQGHRETNLGL